ncbi:hypothetical protein RI367_005691 [Sorochytrium milnesiophthora]
MNTRTVTWTVDVTSLGFTFGILDIIIQSISFSLMCYTLYTTYQQLRRNPTYFWKASMAGVLCLAPVPLFEIAYSLSSFSSQSLWPFSPMLTLLADILLRIACVLLTLCRFRRLLIVSNQYRHAQVVHNIMSLVIVVAMTASLWSNCVLRVTQLQTGVNNAANSITPAGEADLVNRDRIIGFVTFVIVFAASIATDTLFLIILTRAADGVRDASKSGGKPSATSPTPTDAVSSVAACDEKRRQRRQFIAELMLPYAPSALVAILYFVLQVLAIVAPWIPRLNYSSIALNRFAPAVEAFVFYNVTVRQTRKIMREGAHASRSTPAGRVSSATKASGADQSMDTTTTNTAMGTRGTLGSKVV